MKNRREFLKFLGIGAGAAASVAIAVVAGRGGTPVTPPRAITDIEAPKPYIGPDGVPGGDFIKRKPDILRDYIPVEEIQMPPLSQEMRDEMVDNVFRTSPFYAYLTTTGTQVMDNAQLTISNEAIHNTLIKVEDINSEAFYNWSTVWDEMAPDGWDRNE